MIAVRPSLASGQEQSVSLLSVLRNPEGASRIGTTLESSSEMENQDPRMATGGRCRTTVRFDHTESDTLASNQNRTPSKAPISPLKNQI